MKRLYNNKVLATIFVLQPIIDIITGIMKNYFSLSLSLAMIIRFLFIIYAGIYILKNNNKKINLYIGLWILYVIISIIGNTLIKPDFSIIKYLYDIFKFSYFSICLLFFYLYFKNNKSINYKVMSMMGVVIGLSLLISIVSNTSFCSYPGIVECLQRGYQGYIFSANEYGGILIALLGLNLIYIMKKKSVFSFISLMLVILYLSLLGTKTAFLGLIILLSAFILYHFIFSIFSKKKRKDNKYIALLLIVLLFVGINIKNLPFYFNIELVKDFTEEVMRIEYANDIGITPLDEVEIKEEELPQEEILYEEKEELTDELIEEKQKNAIIYSRRDEFLRVNKKIYHEASLFNKLFGLTTQGNYYEGNLVNIINERDIYDIYMFYGIIGFIIELILPLYLIYKFIKNIFKNIKVIFNNEVVILGITLLLMMLVSFMAGHTFLHPSVSFYVAYIIITLYKKVGMLS